MTLSTPPRRRLPFLTRNWSQGISRAAEGVNGVDHGHEDRPSKRPKLARDVTPEPAGAPAKNALPNSPPHAPRSLRVNVVKLAHKDSERRLKQSRTLINVDGPAHPHDSVTTRASCKITILDSSPLSAHMPPVVCCMTQECTIRTFTSSFGSRVARVHLDKPFLIPEKSLRVIREDNTRGLADNYRLDVELYAGDDGEWPPLECSIPAELNNQGTRRWVLLACLNNLFEKRRESADLFLHQYTRERLLTTEFAADIDARWSTGLEDLHATPEGMMHSITVGGGGDLAVLPAVRQNGFITPEDMVNGDGTRDMDDEFDPETTPNRALRTRANTTVYNLKQLTDKAHGKAKKSRSRDDGHVSYLLPEEMVTLDSYRCIACGQPHRSIKFLRTHLALGHPEYKYDLRSVNGVHQFRVTHNYERYSTPPEEFQFTRSAEGINIDQIVRQKGAEREREEEVVPLRSAQPRQRTSARRRGEKPKVLVPNTGQPMYDSVSRALLEPGTELVPPKADHSWRIQLHRDNIADYVDIPSPEREYISAWDAFSLPRGLSSEVYFSGMFVDYTREKAPWLVASGQRMEEFLKHVASLQLRGVLEQSTMEEVLEIIGEAREATSAIMEVDGEEGADPGDWQAGRRVENCEVCGQAAATIVCILVCSNKQKSCNRHFHLSCIRDTVRMDPLADDWLCDDCAPEGETRSRRGVSPVTA